MRFISGEVLILLPVYKIKGSELERVNFPFRPIYLKEENCHYEKNTVRDILTERTMAGMDGTLGRYPFAQLMVKLFCVL